MSDLTLLGQMEPTSIYFTPQFRQTAYPAMNFVTPGTISDPIYARYVPLYGNADNFMKEKALYNDDEPMDTSQIDKRLEQIGHGDADADDGQVSAVLSPEKIAEVRNQMLHPKAPENFSVVKVTEKKTKKPVKRVVQSEESASSKRFKWYWVVKCKN